MARSNLEQRVEDAAEATLKAQKYVSAIDVLLGLRWLTTSHIDSWSYGGIESLESAIQTNPDKVAAALAAFQRWAQEHGLNTSETDYVSQTRDRHPLRFSVDGDEAIERAYRTHWVSPDLDERTIKRQSKPPDLLAIIPVNDWTCTSCSGTGDFLFMEDAGPLCLDCADFGHLEFLPAGDAALTRRAKKASGLSAVVVKWSRSRKRYERQGILAEPAAIERAERECLSDADVRARRRERDQVRRADEDVRFQAEFAEAILAQFPRDDHKLRFRNEFIQSPVDDRITLPIPDVVPPSWSWRHRYNCSDATTPHRYSISAVDGCISNAWTWQATLSRFHANAARSAESASSSAFNTTSLLREFAQPACAPSASHR